MTATELAGTPPAPTPFDIVRAAAGPRSANVDERAQHTEVLA